MSIGTCVPGESEERRRVDHAIRERREGRDCSVRANLQQRVRAGVSHHLLACKRENSVRIRVDFVAGGVARSLETAEIGQQAPFAIRRRTSDTGQLCAVRPEHRLPCRRIATEADGEEKVTAAMQRQIVRTDGEHVPILGGERGQAGDDILESACRRIVAADCSRLPIAPRPLGTGPARAVAAAAGLRNVERAFRSEGDASRVVKAVDHHIPRGRRTGDQWLGDAECKGAERYGDTFDEQHRFPRSWLLKCRADHCPRSRRRCSSTLLP